MTLPIQDTTTEPAPCSPSARTISCSDNVDERAAQADRVLCRDIKQRTPRSERRRQRKITPFKRRPGDR